MWQFLETTLRDTTPIALAALAGVLAFRVGVFHLGLEGLMCAGAFAAVAVTKATGSVALGLVATVAICLLLSLLYWWVIDRLRANVIIAGLGLTGIGVAGSTFALQTFFGTQGAIQVAHGLPRPVTGHTSGPLSAVSGLTVVTWLLPVLVLAVWWLVRRTTLGLRMSAVGEYPFAARSAGASPSRLRLLALLLGGVLCALAGADLALGGLEAFTPGMTAGRGYIAFTAVVFGAAGPIGAALASLFFGAADALGIVAQLEKWPVPVEIVMMLPYVLTLVAVSIAGRLGRAGASAQAGYAELRT
jgi:simple sugar transport system permease protein